MAEIDYNEIKKLYYQYIQENVLPIIQTAMNNSAEKGGEFWTHASDLIVQGVEHEVHGVYSPKKYQRRTKSGLSDPENVIVSVGDMEFSGNSFSVSLQISNKTGPGPIEDENGNFYTPSGGPIEDDILMGRGYKFPYPKGAGFLQERNFYSVYENESNEAERFKWLTDEIADVVKSKLHDAAVYAVTTVLTRQ